MEPCLIVFPSTRSPEDRCPRCHRRAGDHPAPLDLVDSPLLPVDQRPTYYGALAIRERRDAIVAVNKVIGHVESERERSRYVSGEAALEHLEGLGYTIVPLDEVQR